MQEYIYHSSFRPSSHTLDSDPHVDGDAAGDPPRAGKPRPPSSCSVGWRGGGDEPGSGKGKKRGSVSPLSIRALESTNERAAGFRRPIRREWQVQCAGSAVRERREALSPYTNKTHRLIVLWHIPSSPYRHHQALLYQPF